MFLGEWLTKWLELYVEPSKRAARTKEMYRYTVRSVPVWLQMIDLDDLTVIDLQTWLVQMAQQRPRAAQQCRVMLSQSMRLAAKLGLSRLIIDRDTLPMPVHTARKAAVLDQDQIAAYVAAVRSSPVAPLLMLCLCGLRRGEALGVMWSDFDLDEGVLHVERQRIRTTQGYQVTRLKTSHSVRSLMLPSGLRELLAVWPRSISGFLVDTTPEKLQREHRRAMQRAGLTGVTVHGLRHSFAALAAKKGVSMKLLQAALGHATIALTANLYADHLDSASDVARVLYTDA